MQLLKKDLSGGVVDKINQIGLHTAKPMQPWCGEITCTVVAEDQRLGSSPHADRKLGHMGKPLSLST